MKRHFLFLFVLSLLLVNIAAAQKADSDKLPEEKLLNQPMPEFMGQTLTGKKIDKAYFKGKVTVVNFMYIGCFACMKEINALNQLQQKYQGNNQFQILGISANT